MKNPVTGRYQPVPNRAKKGFEEEMRDIEVDPSWDIEPHQLDNLNATHAQTEKGLLVPEFKSENEWAEFGLELQSATYSLLWATGVWWNAGEKYKNRLAIVRDPRWRGPSYKTCRNAGSVVAKLSRRRDKLTYSHHQAVAALPTKEAAQIIDEAQKAAEAGHAPTVKHLRRIARDYQHDKSDIGISSATQKAARRMGNHLYNVILADPPWRFETYSEAGKERSPDNHYPTMKLEQICALGPDIPAAPDCVLFLWRTREMMKQAIEVAEAWGFTPKSEFIWVKPGIGLGYYNRGKHEVLMVCTRGNIRAPREQDRLPSVFEAPKAEHSVKPDCVYEMIERMYPDPRFVGAWANAKTGDIVPEYYIELFARRARRGWANWGNHLTVENTAAAAA
jgi:N6-adenosine-specific RNA methylase IME4